MTKPELPLNRNTARAFFAARRDETTVFVGTCKALDRSLKERRGKERTSGHQNYIDPVAAA